MLIDERHMKADGLTDAEIQQIVARLHDTAEARNLDTRPALLFSVKADNTRPRLVCVEYAEALENSRPEYWHAILADGRPPDRTAGRHAKRSGRTKGSTRSIDDLFDPTALRRHPPTKKTCWVCGHPWERYDPPWVKGRASDLAGFPQYPVIIVPILIHLRRMAPPVGGIPPEIAVCFGCFNKYARIYHCVVEDLLAEVSSRGATVDS